MKESQNIKILAYLKTHDGITGKEARMHCKGCTRLPARIKDLERKGYAFDKEWDFSLNEDGRKVRFKRYRLAVEDDQ